MHIEHWATGQNVYTSASRDRGTNTATIKFLIGPVDSIELHGLTREQLEQLEDDVRVAGRLIRSYEANNKQPALAVA